jgi:hypothetical protein
VASCNPQAGSEPEGVAGPVGFCRNNAKTAARIAPRFLKRQLRLADE